MKSAQIPAALILAASLGIVAVNGASAIRGRAAERDAAAASRTPAATYADEAAHQENQQSREQRWNQASPNQKATTYNVANSKHKTKETNKQDMSAAHTSNVSARHGQ
jgi:hypothetical protein